MTVEELAEELYELIVVRGRWGGKRRDGIMGEGTYTSLPEWSKEMWRDHAVKFAAESNFKVDQ